MAVKASACERASSYLKLNADSLVESWINWLRTSVQTSTITALPEQALRNHIPPILLCIAEYIRSPVEITRQELRAHLRLHGQIRRDQGFSLQEVLAEFDGLAEVVTEGVNRELSGITSGNTHADTLEAATRLSSGLRTMSYIAMGTYTDTDQEREQETSSDLEEILRAITHEMSSPLNALTLNLNILLEEAADPEDLPGTVNSMQSSLQRVVSLLGTIKSVAVAEHARSGARQASLHVALINIIQEYSDEFAAHEIDVRLSNEIPNVSMEAVPLFILMTNLLTNSIKYVDAQKKKRYIEVSAKVIREEHDSGFCEIAVTDNGVGIADEYHARIFQKGFRAHPELSHGTGFGLFLVQQALIARGGSIEVSSQVGVQTTIRARLRCLSPQENAISSNTFKVEHLMGKRPFNKNFSSPKLPA